MSKIVSWIRITPSQTRRAVRAGPATSARGAARTRSGHLAISGKANILLVLLLALALTGYGGGGGGAQSASSSGSSTNYSLRGAGLAAPSGAGREGEAASAGAAASSSAQVEDGVEEGASASLPGPDGEKIVKTA